MRQFCFKKIKTNRYIPILTIEGQLQTHISPIHVGRHFRKFALKSRFIQNFELKQKFHRMLYFSKVRFIQNFELWGNNWSLQINGRITKSRFIKISQSRLIFAKVALFKKFELRWNN